MGSFDGNLPERVDANDRADQEEEDVEAAEVTAELALLFECGTRDQICLRNRIGGHATLL